MPQKSAAPRPPKPGKAKRNGGDGKGSGVSPRKQKTQSSIPTAPSPDGVLPLRSRQQRILDAFAAAYADVVRGPEAEAKRERVLREIKGALFGRDFGAAFGTEERLGVYAARWSPTRALCYARILGEVVGEAGEGSGLLTRGGGDGSLGLRSDGQGTLARMKVEGDGGGDGKVMEGAKNEILERCSPASTGSPGMEAMNDRPSAGEEEKDITGSNGERDSVAVEVERLNILSVGGTPAELAATTSLLSSTTSGTGSMSRPKTHLHIRINLLDSAPWSSTIDKLSRHLTRDFLSSIHPGAGGSDSDNPLASTSPNLTSTFIQRDVLSLSTAELSDLLPEPALVTLFFTLNELYTISGVGRTTGFLMRLSEAVKVGSLLLVTDSPGSYSEAAIGGGKGGEGKGEKRKYPMHWLLEHTLLRSVEDAAASNKKGVLQGREERKVESVERVVGNEEMRNSKGETNGQSNAPVNDEDGSRDLCRWEKVESKESVWFRLDSNLRYPIKLEDMRYQMHLYRAVERRKDGV